MIKLTRAQWRTLFVVWLTYGAFYLCRVNIGPARVDVQREIGVDALEMGLVLGSLKIGYALGQLLNGQLAERFGPRRILLTGLFGSVAACVLFASVKGLSGVLAPVLPGVTSAINAVVRIFSSSATLGPLAALLLLVWFTNGLFQAGGWPPSVKIMSNWYTPEQRGRMMGVIGTSYQLGSALTILLSGALVTAAGGDFRIAFYVPAVMLAVVGAHAFLRMREAPTEDEAPGVSDAKSTAVVAPRLPLRETLLLTFTNPRIWVLAIGLFGLDIVRYGFLDWAPGHLSKMHGSGSLLSAIKIAVLPLSGAVGALVSGWVSDRYFQSRRAPVIAITLGLVGVLTIAYGAVVPLGVAPTIACLAGIGFCLYGAQILLVGTAAQDFAKKHTTAAAAGFVDFMGYFGAFGGDVVTGWLLKHRTFEAAIQFWAVAALVASLLVATLWRASPIRDAAATH